MRRHRKAILILGALLPLGVVIFVNYLTELHAPYVLPKAGPPNPDARDIVASLSAELNQIALLVLGGCVVLFREQREKELSRPFWIAGVAVLSTAIASCFAGFRYRIALAHQISAGAFNLDRISDRLGLQMWLLILSLSALIVLAMLAFIPAAPAPSAVGAETQERR